MISNVNKLLFVIIITIFLIWILNYILTRLNYKSLKNKIEINNRSKIININIIISYISRFI
ncbi:MAG: hypothetical protein N4P93_00895, partial [Candidatus Lightella neohaematopini]|nr:hypothetical protein [Candidatus Lightella neohaematopini]